MANNDDPAETATCIRDLFEKASESAKIYGIDKPGRESELRQHHQRTLGRFLASHEEEISSEDIEFVEENYKEGGMQLLMQHGVPFKELEAAGFVTPGQQCE